MKRSGAATSRATQPSWCGLPGSSRSLSSRSAWRRCSASWPLHGNRRNGARWAIALALGLRQGEALALRWDDIDLKAKTLRVRATRLRPVYEHGCDGTCGKTAGYCPDRRQRNGPREPPSRRLATGSSACPTNSLRSSRRTVAEPDRRTYPAGSLWEEGGWVFATRLGRPIIPNTDYLEWEALLQRAGVRHARLHDARHTAATVLLVLGVPERTVMSIMGWSSTSMAARYQHVTDPIRREVANRVGGLLFGESGLTNQV